MSEREKFESWWCEHVFTPPHGGSLREYAFAAWQASRRDALEEAEKVAFDFVFDAANAVEARKIERAIRALSHAKEK